MGDGTTIDKTTITQVTGLTNIIAIEAGGYHSMALCSDGSYYVWGSNAYGQLGDGTTANKTSPLQLTSISDVEQMSAGGHHTLIRKYNGRVYAFGLNNVGQLGDGTYDNRTTPVLLNEPISAKDISAGFNHSLIAAGGTIYASGSNEYMQLGIERLLGSNVPIVSCIQFYEVKPETEFSIIVFVDDMVSFTGKTFTVTYDPNILILLDACGFTWDKEIASSTQILQGTDVRILSISEGTIVFEVVKTVPANTTWSGSVNIIHFRKLHTGDPNLSLVMN